MLVLVGLLSSCGVTMESKQVDNIRLSDLGPEESLVISYANTGTFGQISGVMRIDGSVAWTLGRQVILTEADRKSLEDSIGQGHRPDPNNSSHCNGRASYATVRVRGKRVFEHTPLRFSCRTGIADMNIHKLAELLFLDNSEISVWNYAQVPIDADTIELFQLDERKR